MPTDGVMRSRRSLAHNGDASLVQRGRPPAGRRTKRGPAVGRIDVKLPRRLIDEIERLVADRIYLSKADFVRSADGRSPVHPSP